MGHIWVDIRKERLDIKRERLEYVRQMLRELGEIAASDRYRELGYLIEMAYFEACEMVRTAYQAQGKLPDIE